MFLFRWPASLWFLAGGGTAPSSASINVSVVYALSASISEFDREIDLSALAFNLSCVFELEDEDAVAVQANIDLDGNAYQPVDLKASITPVFVLDQTGGISKDVTAAYNLSASISAAIRPDVVPVLAYNLSASLSAVLLISDNIDVAAAYNVTASIQVALQTQTDTLTPTINAAYGMSASINAQLDRITSGGLVWSQKKQRYVAVRVGL